MLHWRCFVRANARMQSQGITSNSLCRTAASKKSYANMTATDGPARAAPQGAHASSGLQVPGAAAANRAQRVGASWHAAGTTTESPLKHAVVRRQQSSAVHANRGCTIRVFIWKQMTHEICSSQSWMPELISMTKLALNTGADDGH